MNKIKISENFRLDEFQCKCGCGTVKLDSLLLDRLQRMRTMIGRPITINSGYRCETHNRRVGGAANSQHLYGKAADIAIRGMPVAQLYKICEQHFPDGGVGRYDTFVHVDTRGKYARF